MAIPFYSIDFRRKEMLSFCRGLIPSSRGPLREALVRSLKEDFSDYDPLIFPSARMAFYLTLQSKFKEGDEIIFPVLGFPLYVKIACQLGLIPKFVDVEPTHLTMDPEKLRAALSPGTRGLIVTHLFGHPARMDEIMEIASQANLYVIEDCAQSYDSSFRGQPTGTFGDAGIFSCSLMKVPTTLGGGILISKDRALVQDLKGKLQADAFSDRLSDKLGLFVKNSVSILNSYPLLYTLLSHQVFGLIKRRDPQLLRKILYSGLGMDGQPFDVWERPRLTAYQIRIGLSQFSRTREMTNRRREYSRLLDQRLETIERIRVLPESADVFWNYQYYVIEVRGEGAMKKVYDRMFKRGIHLMEEDVWDCTAYDFSDRCEAVGVGVQANKGLIRIPNNSLLSPKHIEHIASVLAEVCAEL